MGLPVGLAGLWHAVEICVLNSLDAKATDIHCEVDVVHCCFRVSDNGCGIRAEDLPILGTTSVTCEAQHIGSRGRALTAVCATSIVEITSRPVGQYETYTCLSKGGVPLYLKLSTEQRRTSGTVITVKDVFYNRPVARKAMATEGLLSQVNRCRDVVGALALIHPNVTLTLYDRSRRMFIAKFIKGRSPSQAAARFFGFSDSSLVASVDSPPGMSPGGWCVSGWAAMPPQGYPTTSRQRLFFNGRAVKLPEATTLVDGIFRHLCGCIIKQLPRKGDELMSLKRANNQHSMFILTVSCPTCIADYIPAPDGGTLCMEDINPLLEALNASFLAAWRQVLSVKLTSMLQFIEDSHGHDAPRSAPARLGMVRSGIGQHRGDVESRIHPFATAMNYSDEDAFWKLLNFSAGTSSLPKHTGKWPSTTGLSSRIAGHMDTTLYGSASEGHNPAIPSSAIPWRQRRLNTDVSLPASSGPIKRPRKNTAARPHQTFDSLSGLESIMRTWNNPAMMPAAATGSVQSILTIESLETTMFVGMRPEALEKRHLQGARVMPQIDGKFVPIISRGGLLSLLDQHAADERVQLERLRAKTVAADGRPLNGSCLAMLLPAPQFLRLGSDEFPLLEAHVREAHAWGWRWQVGTPSTDGIEIAVTHVPVVANRGLTTTDLRLYLHQLAETRGGGGPPAGVNRVLASRACRSAIMFGDRLTLEKCAELICSLQKTRLCFICAHGRPTTVPIADLMAVGRAATALRAAEKEGKGADLSTLKSRLLREISIINTKDCTAEVINFYIMGESQYSFSLTTFSPSGKLVQIEYALNAVNAGATSLGIKASNGVVLATEKKLPSILVDESTVQKISLVTPNIGATYSGMGPDSRVLVRKARKSGQVYYRQYHEHIPVAQLVRETATVMQEFTQSGGVRPFGVSLLMAGYDENGPQLYQVDPSGSYFAWKASAIGKNMVNAKAFLEKRYSEEMELEDAIHTALLTLKEGFEGELSGDNVEVGIVGSDGKFRVLTASEVSDYLREVE